MKIATIGIDLAKNLFQVHGVASVDQTHPGRRTSSALNRSGPNQRIPSGTAALPQRKSECTAASFPSNHHHVSAWQTGGDSQPTLYDAVKNPYRVGQEDKVHYHQKNRRHADNAPQQSEPERSDSRIFRRGSVSLPNRLRSPAYAASKASTRSQCSCSANTG